MHPTPYTLTPNTFCLSTMDDDLRPRLQLVWGVLLVLAGVGMFFRIPQVMPQIRQIDYFAAVIPFIYFCMYFVAVFLIAGGARKLYLNYQAAEIRHPAQAVKSSRIGDSDAPRPLSIRQQGVEKQASDRQAKADHQLEAQRLKAHRKRLQTRITLSAFSFQLRASSDSRCEHLQEPRNAGSRTEAPFFYGLSRASSNFCSWRSYRDRSPLASSSARFSAWTASRSIPLA